MLIDAVKGYADSSRRKISRTGCGGRRVRIVKKQTFSHRRENITRHNPVGNLIMFFGRVHIPNVLSVVLAPDCIAHTDKLARLFDDAPDISPLADTGKLTIRNLRAVSDYGSYRPHSVVAFSPSLALNQAGKQLSSCVGHKITSFLKLSSSQYMHGACFVFACRF